MNEKISEHIEAVKRLLKGQQKETNSSLSDDEILFLAELGEWINSGKIAVDFDLQRFFDLVGDNYPIAASRIAWPAIRDHEHMDVRSEFKTSSVHCDDLAKGMADKRGIIQQWFSKRGITENSRVVVIGDVHDAVLKMTLETLLECYPILFVQPQHTYVLPVDGAWCFMGTVEGEIYFGEASNVLATGVVDLESFLK